jgi:hypothetical protein
MTSQIQFSCKICNKTYYSYAALYTHKRNKHNVIPVTSKPKIFEEITDFKFVTNLTKEDICRIALSKFQQICSLLYTNTDCLLHFKNFNIFNHQGYNHLIIILNDYEKDYLLTPETCIDDALCYYMINFVEVSSKETFLEIVFKFCILLREYLNLVGFNSIELYKQFNIINFNEKGQFTKKFNCIFIPDLMNDFLSVFMTLDKLFYIDEKYLIHIAQNFCGWIFNNNLTNFKVLVYEEENHEIILC